MEYNESQSVELWHCQKGLLEITKVQLLKLNYSQECLRNLAILF